MLKHRIRISTINEFLEIHDAKFYRIENAEVLMKPEWIKCKAY